MSLDAYALSVAAGIHDAVMQAERKSAAINSLAVAANHLHNAMDILRTREHRYALLAQYSTDAEVKLAYGERLIELRFVLKLLETNHELQVAGIQMASELLTGESSGSQ